MAKSFFNTGLLGAAGTSTGGPPDDQFNRVSFLSHFDGSNNGVNNAFDDSSASNHTITANGNVTQGSFGPFARPDGEWGVSFDGAADYLSAPNSSDWALADGEFTVEAWVFMTPNGSVKQAIVGHWTNGSRGWQARTEPSGSGYKLRWTWSTNGSADVVYTGSIVADFYTWNHVAFVRASDTVTLYVNGVAGGTVSGANIYTPNTPLVIGDWDSNAADFNGFISNLRLVKGTAVYTGNFTPSTSKLTAITNTKLLTCQSNRFVDNSSNGHTITPSGNPAVTAFGPFLTSAVYDPAVNGASGYFDGSGDYLTTPYASSIANWYSTDYTIEAWVYYTAFTESPASPGHPNVLKHGQTGSANDYWSFGAIANGTLKFYYFNGSAIDTCVSTATLSLNTWHHIAMCHDDSDNEINLYLDGVSVKTHTVAGTPQSSSSSPFIMIIGEAQSTYFTGYMSDLRVTHGTEVYTSAFTPPTAPLTDITNTKLLLNMADAQAIDSTAQNNLTLVGTAKTSTAQYKFGTASLLLDGNSDYATFPENGGNDIDGGVNWTVEFFWRFVNKTSPSIQEIISKGAGLQIYTINGSLGFALSANNSGTYFINSTGGTTLDNDTFYHIALVKNGTSYKLYLNGTSDLSATSSSNIDTGGYPWFLGTISGAESTYPSNGYMDEVRISKFARYTSNFTAPTKAFADKGQ